MREDTAIAEQKSSVGRRKKLALAASGTVAGIAGIAVLAAWSGTSLTETEFGAGTFGVEINVDGSEDGWVMQSAEGVGGSSLQWHNAVSGDPINGQADIYPYDELETSFQLRLADNVNRSVDISSIEAALTEGDEAVDITWGLSGEFEGGTASAVQASGSAVGGEAIVTESFTDLTLGGEDLTLDPGEVLTITIDAEVGETVDEDTMYGASWAFLNNLSQPGS